MMFFIVCSLSFSAKSTIKVSANISRGVLKPEHELVINEKNNSISFNIQKEMILHVSVILPKPKYTLTTKFFIGTTGNGYKYMLNQGIYVSYNDGLSWTRLDFAPISDGWYKVIIADEQNIRIATSIPYGQENVDKLITLVLGNPKIGVRTLGKEPRTFKIFDFGIDDGKKPIHYIVAGEDIWETAGSWTADAMVRYLTNNPAVLEEITSHHLIRIVPAITPYSMTNNMDGFLDDNDKTVYGSATWAEENPPGEVKYMKNEVLGIISPASGPTNLDSGRLHWLLNLHSWWAMRDYSGMQSINKSYKGIELLDDSDSSRVEWLKDFLKSNIENIPRKHFTVVPAWHAGLPRDYFIERYNFISSVLEVCTYKQGIPEFTTTGEAIINNLKRKGNNYDWSKLYSPVQLFNRPSKLVLNNLTLVNHSFQVPEDYLREREDIPSFWLTTVDEVTEYLNKNVRKGQVEIIGISAGGRPIHAVVYGKPRLGKGTSTFSGSLGFRNVRAYRGPDHEKTVYMGMSSVHGGEFEGIVGTVNLISIIETGKDLRGKEWPEITAIVTQLDRLILIPIVNPDGRNRIPLRMEAYRNTDHTVHEYLNTGGKPDGVITGWPQIKEFIPMDFTLPGFPGGYPNDAGVNIQHDDFFGNRQPETQALFDLAEREHPDLIMNMHTGAVYMLMHRPFGEPALSPIFDTLFSYVHTGLALHGLQRTNDPKVEANPHRVPIGVYNLDGALNLHCGALSVVVESPSHGFSGKTSKGEKAFMTPEMLLNAQLICHQEAMRFLVESGGRSKWTLEN